MITAGRISSRPGGLAVKDLLEDGVCNILSLRELRNEGQVR